MKWKQRMILVLASIMLVGLSSKNVGAVQDDGIVLTAYASNDSPEVKEKVQEIVQECKAQELNDEWEIALWLHDWLIVNANYDFAHSRYHASGVLLDGLGMSQSYAEAYQLLLNEFGIENMLISSYQMNHVWNLVKINGVWCHVDCAGDDPIWYDEETDSYMAGGYEQRLYFGMSDAEISTDHIWSEAEYPKCTSTRNSIILRGMNLVENPQELEYLFLTMYEMQATYFECYYIGTDENFSLVDEMEKILYQYDALMLDWNLYYSEDSEDYVVLIVQFSKFDGEHTHRYKELPLEPYCEKAGGTLYKCACGYMYEVDFINPLEHEWSEWILVTEPTLSTSGIQKRICDVCWKEEIKETSYDNLSGTCGENLTWELARNGVLTISGTGNMYDMESGQAWNEYQQYITSVVIEDGVTSIGASAFYYCPYITSVQIPNSVTDIGKSAFQGCENLVDIEIPDNLTVINEGVFRSCRSLSSVEIPFGVTSIGAMAFCDCVSLTNVEIPASVTSISICAFQWCRSLTQIEIPEGVSKISRGTFLSCENLVSVRIPASVTSMEENAFGNCDNLTEVYYGGTEAMWSEIDFGPYTEDVQRATIHCEGQGATEKPKVTNVFSDVFTYDWFVDAIQFVFDNGMMSGNVGYFKPYDNMTRAMMVTTLYRLSGSPEVIEYKATELFDDVEAGSWYEDAVNWAYNTGVTTGYTDIMKFGSYDFVTREQLAVFLYRYAQMQGYDTTVSANITDYVGYDKISEYAKEAMQWAVGTGLISGVESVVDGVTIRDLDAKGSATRAQLATILMRFCKFYEI